jgi:acyl-coenzyme A thioesterase PaaI-like protein
VRICRLWADARDVVSADVEYKINLVAPAAGEMLIARARVVRSGKTLKICAADVFAIKDGKETLCATTLSTIMAMHDKADSPSKT